MPRRLTVSQRTRGQRLTPIRWVLVFGMIEWREGRFVNSAVVIASGAVAGVYRKTHLTEGEPIFAAGDAYYDSHT